jgi:hypothetical protein
MKINKKYHALSAIVVLAVAAGVFWYTDEVSAPTLPARAVPQTQQAAPQPAQVTLTIDGLYSAKPVAITQGQTVLSVLQMLDAQDPQLQLVTKEYAGLGTLIVGMRGVTNGIGKKYWQYKVNGVMPQVGAGQLQLKDGDSVDWFFDSSQQ